MYEYQITQEDKWLLDTHQTDPITHEPFKVGDAVVICATCRTVHYVSTWAINPEKPCSNCEGNDLIDFNTVLAGVFRRDGSNVLRIRNRNDNIEQTRELEQTQNQLRRVQGELQQTNAALQRTQDELSQSRRVIIRPTRFQLFKRTLDDALTRFFDKGWIVLTVIVVAVW